MHRDDTRRSDPASPPSDAPPPDIFRLPPDDRRLARPPSVGRPAPVPDPPADPAAERLTLQSMAATRTCLIGLLADLDAAGTVGPWHMTLGRLQREVERDLLARVGLPAVVRVMVPRPVTFEGN